MSLKAIVDEVPESLTDHYTKRDDGKFQLAVDPVGDVALEDVGALKHVLSDVKSEKKKLQEALGKFKGVSADDALDAIERVAKLGSFDPEKEADKLAAEKFEASKRALVASHTKEVQSLTEKLTGQDKLIDGLVRGRDVDAALVASGAVQDSSRDVIREYVMNRTRIVTDDNGVRTEVLGANGVPLMDNDGKNVSVEKFVVGLKASDGFSRFFAASGATGTGKVPNSSGGSGLKRSAMSAAEKMSYLENHSQEEYLKLPA